MRGLAVTVAVQPLRVDDLHPTTLRLMQQVAELDGLIREYQGRQQVQITLRSLEGKPAKEAWFSVH